MLAALDLAQLGYDDSNGIDPHFLQKAGDRAIIALLIGYLERSPAAVMDSTATLFDAWQAGDEACLDRIVHQDIATAEAKRPGLQGHVRGAPRKHGCGDRTSSRDAGDQLYHRRRWPPGRRGERDRSLAL
jgi:hypothetical protein